MSEEEEPGARGGEHDDQDQKRLDSALKVLLHIDQSHENPPALGLLEGPNQRFLYTSIGLIELLGGRIRNQQILKKKRKELPRPVHLSAV